MFVDRILSVCWPDIIGLLTGHYRLRLNPPHVDQLEVWILLQSMSESCFGEYCFFTNHHLISAPMNTNLPAWASSSSFIIFMIINNIIVSIVIIGSTAAIAAVTIGIIDYKLTSYAANWRSCSLQKMYSWSPPCWSTCWSPCWSACWSTSLIDKSPATLLANPRGLVASEGCFRSRNCNVIHSNHPWLQTAGHSPSLWWTK